MARISKTLPAGRYAAFYATDDSHDPSEWNARAAARSASLGPARSACADRRRARRGEVVRLRARPGQRRRSSRSPRSATASRARARFSLARAMDVRVYALGEGTRRTAWSTTAGSPTRPPTRRCGRCATPTPSHAGGAAKNRLVDRTIRLDKGDYVVHYVTDDSHSCDVCNASRRPTRSAGASRCWPRSGTLERSAVSEYAEKPDPSSSRRSSACATTRTRGRSSSSIAKRRSGSTRSAKAAARSSRTTAGSRTRRPARTVWEMTYRVDRTGRRRGEEPPLRRRDHASGRRVRAPLRDRRLAFVRVVEREPARRPRHVAASRFTASASEAARG